MAGHSKWANIQHRKGRQDAKRGKIFTKLIREITVSAKGGDDPAANPRLRLAVDKALGANMSRDTIDRAIKRGSGSGDDANVDEIRYEGYGVSGVAVLVDCMTDNRNRTAAEVRHAFSKYGGNLGTSGSVAYLFNKSGVLLCANVDEETLMDVALSAGAEDIIAHDDDTYEVLTDEANFIAVKEALQAAGITPDMDEVTMRPEIDVAVDTDTATQLLKMLDALEDLDDVQAVYSNADIPQEAY